MRKSDGSNNGKNDKVDATSSHATSSASNGVTAEVIVVPCPICKKEALFSRENPYRPFCSERCQMTDLGTWAQEKYRIPTASMTSEFDSDLDSEMSSENDADSESENRH